VKRFLKWSAGALFAVLFLGAALAAHTWYFKPLSINWFYARVFLRFAIDNPELLTQLRIFEPIGIRSHNAHLADASIAHDDRLRALMRHEYETLHRYDATGLVGQDRLSYDVFDHYVGMQLRGERWRFHDYPVNPLFGVQSDLPHLMTQTQQVNDSTDAEHYIARLGEVPRKLDQVIEGLRVREQKGVIPPKFVVEKVVDQIRAFIAPGAKGNALSVGFREKLEKTRLGEAARAALLSRAEQTVGAEVIPAYQRLAAYLETLRPKALRNDGVWALPDGDEYYQYAIESNTTTRMTAEQIHALGLSEVARIRDEMTRVFEKAGYGEGTLVERYRKLGESPAQRYPDSDEGRARILSDYQSIIDEMSAGLDRYFGLKPAAAVVVKRVPAFSEKTAPAAYYNGASMDHTRPAQFFVNLRDVEETRRYRMRTLAYHEAVPGHHLQTAIAQDLKGLPFFRRIVPFTAYDEGWALYAERLAWEAGYQKNPLDDLGRLQDEMFRAVRLVVDTGLHAKRWSREKAIEYMVENTGMSEAEVVVEIERYLVMPGQALAYKVGMLKILELRERAKGALGNRFDIREFHDEILKNGALPLALLERVVDAYIARRKEI
jgi:uncharacterized protein (DUF885 family)